MRKQGTVAVASGLWIPCFEFLIGRRRRRVAFSGAVGGATEYIIGAAVGINVQTKWIGRLLVRAGEVVQGVAFAVLVLLRLLNLGRVLVEHGSQVAELAAASFVAGLVFGHGIAGCVWVG